MLWGYCRCSYRDRHRKCLALGLGGLYLRGGFLFLSSNFPISDHLEPSGLATGTRNEHNERTNVNVLPISQLIDYIKRIVCPFMVCLFDFLLYRRKTQYNILLGFPARPARGESTPPRTLPKPNFSGAGPFSTKNLSNEGGR